ncbi:hypothetical protein SGL43_00347 [Streptomyces globisporus]|uniref:Uncharacterized protein n=1 Tax=Streptomyces globisporus TaxID=1908 RepID=A0ABM9GPQ7_STRGL|nr:hypothetical protein SGL43_00347 [Streptomyces globisporus]
MVPRGPTGTVSPRPRAGPARPAPAGTGDHEHSRHIGLKYLRKTGTER